MTIGDEKVVAWRDVIVPSHASSDQLYNWNAEAVSRDEAESKIAALHSAYAELAAELERANELADKYKWQVRDTCVRAEKAESQLAELRGRCAGLVDAWRDEAAGTWGESKEHATLQRCSDELRAAAGDSP